MADLDRDKLIEAASSVAIPSLVEDEHWSSALRPAELNWAEIVDAVLQDIKAQGFRIEPPDG